MSVLLVTGTGTGVGKTVVTAAVAALAAAGGQTVAVVKPAQTGVAPDEPGDLAEIDRLAAPRTLLELVRFPDPLSPAAAAGRAGQPPLDVAAAADRIGTLAADHDLVLVEGAGGLLVRLDGRGSTLADLAGVLADRHGAELLVVVAAGLGTLNHTALTLEALDARGLRCAGLVVGSWPAAPGLACRSNLVDLQTLGRAPLAGALPAGAGVLDRVAFAQVARPGLGPRLGGTFDAADFVRRFPAGDPADPREP
jgi:dethiobiotin synthetase